MYKELDVYDFVKEFRNSRFKDNFSDMQYAFIYGIIILVPEVSILDWGNRFRTCANSGTFLLRRK